MEPSKPPELVVVIPEPIERQLIELSNGVSATETHAWPECTGIFRADEGHIRLETPSDILYPSSTSLCRHIPALSVTNLSVRYPLICYMSQIIGKTHLFCSSLAQNL